MRSRHLPSRSAALPSLMKLLQQPRRAAVQADAMAEVCGAPGASRSTARRRQSPPGAAASPDRCRRTTGSAPARRISPDRSSRPAPRRAARCGRRARSRRPARAPKKDFESDASSAGAMRGTSSAQITDRCMPSAKFSDISSENSKFCASSGLKSPSAAAWMAKGSRLASSGQVERPEEAREEHVLRHRDRLALAGERVRDRRAHRTAREARANGGDRLAQPRVGACAQRVLGARVDQALERRIAVGDERQRQLHRRPAPRHPGSPCARGRG